MDYDPDELYATGNARLEDEDYDDAIRYLDQAVSVKPDFREAWNRLGDAYEAAGRIGEARTAYEQAGALPVTPIPKNIGHYILPWHNPYRLLLYADETENEAMLRDLEEPCEHLLECYHQDRPRGVDYNDPALQQVYMFRYFPFYIEILPRILEKIPSGILDSVCHDGMEVALLGCGPAPELLGLILFLREAYPEVRKCGVTCYDRAQWDLWRSHVTESMAAEYWPGGTVGPIRNRSFDLLDPERIDPAGASILTMQNCCTDLLANDAPYARIKNTVLDIFERSSPGSIFVLADVAEREVHDLFTSIADSVSGSGEVLLRPAGDGERHHCLFTIPETVERHLFATYARSGNYFHHLVLRRTE